MVGLNLNIYPFIKIKKVLNIKCFSVLSSLLADKNLPLESENSKKKSLCSSCQNKNENKNESESDSEDSSFKSHFLRAGYYPASVLSEDYLRKYIDYSEVVVRNLEGADTETDSYQETHDKWADRNRELRNELERRENEGLIATKLKESANSSSNDNQDSSSNRPASDTGYIGSQGDAVKGNAGGTETSSSIESAVDKANNEKDLSLRNKKKLVEGEDSTIQPSKIPKQDSSDITSDTEPYDITGGEDC